MKKRYATVKRWADYFLEEGTHVVPGTIRNRIENTEDVPFKLAKDTHSHICRVYAEDTVRDLLADLLNDHPQAGHDGFFMKDGVKFGTCRAWANFFHLKDITVSARLKKIGALFIKGRMQGGQVYDFYAESDVRKACADIFKDLPQADKDGFFAKDGVRYGTARAWAKLFGTLSETTILKYLSKIGVNAVKGRSSMGNSCDYYAETDVRKACADLLNFPVADKNGFIFEDKVRFGTCQAWVNFLGTGSKMMVYKRLKKIKATPIQAKPAMGPICNFYSEPDVRKACSDLIDKIDKK